MKVKLLATVLASALLAATPSLALAQQARPATAAAQPSAAARTVLDASSRILGTLATRRSEFRANPATLRGYIDGEMSRSFDRDYAARLVLGVHGRGASDADVKLFADAMADSLMQLACDIARQVVRQELQANPRALLPVVREALDMLSAESKPVIVRLNPQDWDRLKDTLKAEFPQPKIEWLADASVQAGDCKIESAGAQVDGSLERRWQRAVAALGLVSTWYDGAPAQGQ